MTFKEILKYEIKNYFPSYWAIVGLIFGILVNLFAYYFTSKALSPNVNVVDSILHQGYFEYIVLGEILLLVPLLSLSEGQEIYFRYRDLGILEKMFLLKNGPFKSIIYVFLSQVFIKVIYFLITFTLIISFYKTHLSYLHLANLLIVLIFSSLMFIPFFFFTFFLSMTRKKRIGLIHYLIMVFSLASGAYFPLDVLGNSLLIKFLSESPLSVIVSVGRNFIYGKVNVWGLLCEYHLWGWGISFLLINWIFYKCFFKFFKVNVLK